MGGGGGGGGVNDSAAELMGVKLAVWNRLSLVWHSESLISGMRRRSSVCVLDLRMGLSSASETQHSARCSMLAPLLSSVWLCEPAGITVDS